MSIIEDLQTAIDEVVGIAASSVVGIGTRVRGSGVVIAEGRVLTNAHNLRSNTTAVTFSDGRLTQGSVAGIDMDGDLVVLDVDTAGATAVAWGDPSGLKVGSVVFGAAASSSGSGRVTLGTVSAVARAFRGPGGRRIVGSVEHTAPLAPGSSGGPLLDAGGRFVGLNTNRIGEGFYLAIPADDTLRQRVDALATGRSVERPRLGVSIAPSHVARKMRRSVGLPERDGLLIRDVEDGSPAAGAGLKRGDLIVSVAGTVVSDGDALVEAITDAAAPYQVGIVRGAEELTLTIGGSNDSTDAGQTEPETRTPGDA